MSQPIVSIKNQKRTYTLKVERMTVYKQSKIVECTDDEARTYYMFFYKQRYLNIVRAKPLKAGSHAKNAFKKGITFPAPHPLIEATVSDSEPYKKHLFNDLFPKLKKQYSYEETALMATFFESFIKKEQLIRFIKTLFYDNRRNGKMFACYRMYRMLQKFAPSNTWVNSLSSSLDFNKYEPFYTQLDTALKEKDPIYFEQELYDNLYKNESFQKLSHFLIERERWIDDIAVSIQRFVRNPTEAWFTLVQKKLHTHFDDQAYMEILEDIYKRNSTLVELQQELLDAYLRRDHPEDALKLIASQNLTLREDQVKVFDQIVDHIDLEASSVSIEELNTVIASLFNKIPTQAEALLRKSIMMLMKDHSISYIQEWLQPIREESNASIIQKIDEMRSLQDEPNQQLELGELYYEFSQYDQAIECFSWEMELHAQNPKPVQWLSKIYNELGKSHEAKAYQKLYVGMVQAQ